MSQSRISAPSADPIKLQVIPSQVNLNDLDPETTKLYNKKTVQEIQVLLKDKPDGYYSKNSQALETLKASRANKRTWSIQKTTETMTIDGKIIHKEHYFAYYYGKKYNKILGAGGFAKAVLIQNIETGEWAVAKKEAITSEKERSYFITEAKILDKLKRLPAYKNTPITDTKKNHPEKK